MTGLETRNVSRDSLFLLAGLRVELEPECHKVRVRNLSDGGMMGEGNLRIQRGHRVELELPNIGPVAGSVAWVQDNRFGVAFDEEVDSQQARRALIENAGSPFPTHRPSWRHRPPEQPDPTNLRKV